MTIETKIKFQDIVGNQVPRFVRDDFPLLPDFLKSYYVSQEIPGGTLDLIQNLDKYVKVDELYGLKTSTILSEDLTQTASIIKTQAAGNFTVGFPDKNGLIKIDDEIIFYETKTDSNFEGCRRGFSGITSHVGSNTPDKLVFSSSVGVAHTDGAVIENLNILFLQEFFKKVKTQFAPGFTDRPFAPSVDQRNFIFNNKSFYSSKGTDSSFEILFKALYAADVEVVHPDKYLFRPSNAQYKITKDFIAETISGDPQQLTNLTLNQNSTGARGTVTDVVKIPYDKGQYYQISIDSGFSRDISVKGTIFNEFKVNPKTKITNPISIGGTILDVDSTLDFPETGKLIIKDIDDNPVSLAYTGKSINQFYNITGVNNTFKEATDIRLDDYSFAFVGIGTEDQIQVRIGAALQDIEFKEPNNSYEIGDIIKLQSLGVESKIEKASNFTYNIKTNWEIAEIKIIDEEQRKYTLITYDEQYLKIGHKINLTSRDSIPVVVTGTVSQVTSATSFEVLLSDVISLQRTWDFENQILKGNSSKYPYLSDYIANVQNSYILTDTKDVLVASNSLPNYANKETNPYDRRITFTGRLVSTETIPLTTTTDHGFYTGDAIYYKAGITNVQSTTADGITFNTPIESRFNSIEDGVFYVRRVDANNIKLARSKGDLYTDRYVEFTGDVTDNEFIYYDYYQKRLEPQELVRQILPPDNKGGVYITEPGFTGILNNGVEVLNYKSQNSTVYYGDVLSFQVKRGGYNYDVVNPPLLIVNDPVGTGATGVIATEGAFERIEVVNQGYDYIGTPTISITGGNPIVSAKAEANMVAINHILPFNSGEESTGGNGVSLTDNTIGFTTFHKFRDAERVVYDNGGQTNVGGMTTGSSYYVSVVDNFRIKLHNKESDAETSTDPIDLTSFGVGRQFIRAFEVKRVVSSVTVTEPGSGYQNKKRTIGSAGIITSTDSININNHGYFDKEIIRYTAPTTGDSVTGLAENKDYYVVKISENEFSLSEVGIGSTSVDYYYNNQIFASLTKTGGGSFNYQPISVTVEGTIGVSTRSGGQDFSAVLQPIVRGQISSVDLTQAGVGYGASEIINFNRQPVITFSNGEAAQAEPVINNGQIDSVLIQNSGRNYWAPPDVTIESDTGDYAQLTAITDPSTGRINEIKVIKGGTGYIQGNTNIIITAPGLTAQVEAQIHAWQINLFERNLINIGSDDGSIEENADHTSLQYGHIYAPRPLREATYAISGEAEDNTLYGTPDLVRDAESGVEVSSVNHSPILGWAHDGNPIYGPYGFTNNDGSGSIVEMKSGYELKPNETNRPPLSLYPAGFFTEDYQFIGNGHLDQHNGRFAITPDYPKGIYAYHATIKSQNDATGPFENFRRPEFPYFIGATYKSKPNSFNLGIKSIQSEYDIISNGWVRNTRDYHTNSARSGYDYIFNSNDVRKQTLEINEVTLGKVNKIGITTGGTNYQIGDKVVFDNTGTDGRNAQAEVSRIGGQKVNTISVASTTLSNVEFVPSGQSNNIVGVVTTPHNLITGNLIAVSGLSTSIEGFKNNSSFAVGVSSASLRLTSNMVAQTGVEFIGVIGLSPTNAVRENDILTVDQEKVKILDVIDQKSELRILRAVNGTTAGVHTNGALLDEDPRNFVISSRTGILTDATFEGTVEHYFDPAQVVGTGTARGVGIGTTLAFTDQIGVGITNAFVRTQNLWFEDHEFLLNEEVVYKANGGTPILVWTGVAGNPYVNLDSFSKLFTVPTSANTIGIATGKVGLGSDSTGYYVGVDSTAVPSTLYFVNIGVGNTHSLKFTPNNLLTGTVTQNTVTVSTASTHQLENNDEVYVTVKPKDIKNVEVKYNDFNRRIVFDPQDFVAGDIDLSRNTIRVTKGVFNRGDKVIHTASSPAGGLVNEKMYYVVFYNETNIRLVEERTQLISANPQEVVITSTSAGTLSKVNPSILLRKNQQLKFDVSDSSLSFTDDGVTYSAFKLQFFKDDEFQNEFLTTQQNDAYEVQSSGRIGIDSDAVVTLSATDDIPSLLFYKFNPDNIDRITDIKNEIKIDSTAPQFNQINVEPTLYDGAFLTVGVGSTSFKYDISFSPDVNQYDPTIANISYETISETAQGPVVDFKLKSGGQNYKKPPTITGISVGYSTEGDRSGIGSGAILIAQTSSIGQITGTKLNNIGFDYPSDRTLKVIPNLPDIIEVDRLSTIDYVDVTYQGTNYPAPPDIVVIDGFTKEVLGDVDMEMVLGENRLKIIKNTEGIYNVEPRVVPIGNPNGIGIRDLTYSSDGSGTTTNLPNTVRLFFDRTFSNAADFEKGGFAVGERFLLENVSVGLGSTGRGYNSKEYGYKLWTITAASGQIGGANAFIEFVLPAEELEDRVPGVMVPAESAARVVLESHFPRFKTTLKQNQFFNGETVIDDIGQVGVIERWKPESNQLTISTEQEFRIGSKITGQSSKISALVKSNLNFPAEITTGAGATIIHGFQSDSGMLNNSFQRLPDNGYYQKFSYALRSLIPIDTWGDTVKSLSHVAGFDRFGDLDIESKDPDAVITRTEPANFEAIAEIQSTAETAVYPDFDNVSEIAVNVNGELVSRDVLFANRPITDFFQSIGNKAIDIDDFSSLFNNNERTTKFSRVGEFTKNDTFNKVFTLVKDQTFSDERQFSIVSLMQHNDVAFINEYAILETFPELGTFDYIPTTTGWDLTFNPIRTEFNLYDVTNASISVKDNVVGVASTALGDAVSFASTHVDIGIGVTTTIAKMPVAFRSGHFMVQLETPNQDFFGSEVTVIHDGTKVNALEYGQIQNKSGENITGFGTFNATIVGTNVNLDFIPSVGVALTANASSIFLASYPQSSGIGSCTLDTVRLISDKRQVAAGVTTPIATYASDGSGVNFRPTAAYYFVSVEGTGAADGMYETFEAALINSENNEAVVDFGEVSLNTSSLGTVSATSGGNNANLTFFSETPANVIVFGIELQIFDNQEFAPNLPLGNVEVLSNRGRYVGTKLDLQTAFDLKHNEEPIFRKQFFGNRDEGTGGNGVNITKNTINIPDHFFVTGEKVNYSFQGATTLNAVSIEETVVAGIGTTDKLPQELFVVKFGDDGLRFAESAEKALKKNPEVFTITAVGIGTSHHITATNETSKSIISIDNVIQSPIAGTAVTTALSADIVFAQITGVTGITSFAAADLVKIDDEICKVLDVGVGGNNLKLLRAQLGTGLAAHSAGAVVTKLTGNYNINKNTLHFAEAPAGNTPLSTTTDPDSTSFAGIVTHSTFHGRIFTRTARQNSTQETYTNNMVFNDISHEFTGIQSAFTLTTGFGDSKTNAIGFATNNGCVLVNDAFQQPSSLEQGNYNFNQVATATTITFTGEAESLAAYRRPTDVVLGENANRTNYPSGGKILSVGSVGGFAYQPLVAAGGTATVSAAGSITAVSIGNSGSGYRVGVQTTVNVGVQTYGVGIASYLKVGTAVVGIATTLGNRGHIVSINITNTGTGYTDFVHDRLTTMNAVAVAGTTIVSVATTEGINPGSFVSIAQTTLGSPSTQIGIITNVSVTSVGNGNITLGSSIFPAGVGIGTTTPAPVVTVKRYDPPEVIIDPPVSYSNIPLVYSSTSPTGAGQSASVDVIVGQGSSIIDFEIRREGYGFGNGEILTVPIGGTTGIPTDITKTFSEFKLTVQDIHSDEFNGWTFGQLQPIDSFTSLFDGFRKVFQLKINGGAVSLKTFFGSSIKAEQSLLVFVNGLLQKPNYAYNLGSGGSSIVFTTPPKADDDCSVLFYKGTPDIDVALLSIAKTIKRGDTIDINNNPEKDQGPGLDQEPRTILGITSLSSDTVSTSPYRKLGITTDISLLRPAYWRKQTTDAIINAEVVGKDRVELETEPFPTSYLINSVSAGTTEFYVNSAVPFFNPNNEESTNKAITQDFVDIISQNTVRVGLATAIISDTGTVSSVDLTNIGFGYTGVPTLKFSAPPEGSGSITATATATVSAGGTITGITVTNAGTGYTNTNPPVIQIEPPKPVIEFNVDVDSYSGDFGEIVGLGTTTVGGQNKLIFDFFISEDSILRDGGGATSPVGSAITVSGISTGDFFVVTNSNHLFTRGQGVNTPTSLVITNGGSGYKTADGDTSGTRLNVGTTGGFGSGLRVDLTITSGVITAVVIRDQGSGYKLDDSVGLNVSPGSGCVLQINKAFGTLETRGATDASVVVGATTSFLDNVYQVESTEIVTVSNTSIGIATVGSGTTNIRRVFTNIAGLSTDNFSSSILTFDSGNIGVGTATFDTRTSETYTGTILPSSYWANYSWGKITVARDQSNNFDAYTGNGPIGLTTSTIISRSKPLEFRDYAT